MKSQKFLNLIIFLKYFQIFHTNLLSYNISFLFSNIFSILIKLFSPNNLIFLQSHTSHSNHFSYKIN
jgi:hypothetical protein